MKRRLVRYGFIFLALWGILNVAACQLFESWMDRPIPAGLVWRTVATGEGWPVHYYVANEDAGPRIIYVHGTPGSAMDFAAYLSDPIAEHESISIDRPGFGKTRPGDPVLTLHEQAAAIEPLLVERGGRWPVLVGHSMGGPIVLQAAVANPGKVSGLVVLAGAVDPSLERVAWYQRLANLPLLEWLVPPSLRTANREVLPLRQELEALSPRLGEIQCPVIIIHSRDDSLVPFANVAFMEERLPESSVSAVTVLEDRDHFLPWNSAAEVREAITSLAGIGVEEAGNRARDP